MNQEKTKAMERSELKCRKFKMGKLSYFLPATQENRFIFWKSIKRWEKAQKLAQIYIEKSSKKIEYQVTIEEDNISINNPNK